MNNDLKSFFTGKFGLCLLYILSLYLFSMYASAAEETQDRWFPVSVSSIEEDYEVLVDFPFEYNEKGQLVKSPVKLSDITNKMVRTKDYLDAAESENYNTANCFCYHKYGTDFVCYTYIYNDDETVNEYGFAPNPDDIDSYIIPEGYGELRPIDKADILFHWICDPYYNILEYTDGYICSVTARKYFYDDIWKKYLKLMEAVYSEEENSNSEHAVLNDRYDLKTEYESEKSTIDDYIDKCEYYYTLYHKIRIANDEGDIGFYMDCDKNYIPVSYEISSDDYHPKYYNQYDQAGFYYNEYDEYGNLIYRVRYSTNVKEGEPISWDSVSIDDSKYELKTQGSAIEIQQIDRYTYAYGNPAEYSSDAANFQFSKCEKSVDEIVELIAPNSEFGKADKNEDEDIRVDHVGYVSETSSSSDYIIPDSNARYLTEDDVASLSLREINYAKNEIFARVGRKFTSTELQNYFKSKEWYHGLYEPGDFEQYYMNDVMNDYEKVNAEFLSEKEYSINPEGYPLDTQYYEEETADRVCTYDTILEEYRRAIAEEFSGEYTYVSAFFTPGLIFYQGQTIYYTMYDFLNDGLPEMVISIYNESIDEYVIVDFYGTDGNTVQSIEGVEEGKYFMYDFCQNDVVVCRWASGGLSASGMAFYQLYPKAAAGEKIEEIRHDGSGGCYYTRAVTDTTGSDEDEIIQAYVYENIRDSYIIREDIPFEWQELAG